MSIGRAGVVMAAFAVAAGGLLGRPGGVTAPGGCPAGAPDGCLFIAELGLDGRLRPVRGVMPAVLAAASAGCTRAVVAAENAAEAVMVPGVAVVPCQNLRTVLAWLRGGAVPPQPGLPAARAPTGRGPH